MLSSVGEGPDNASATARASIGHYDDAVTARLDGDVTKPTPRDRGSGLKVGRLFGIPIYATPAWFLVPIVISYLFEPNVAAAVPGIGRWSLAVAFVYALLLYASVLLHELSHALVALRFGLPVRRITLHLLGGLSEIEEEPPTPWREFAVAAAGPALSLALGGVGIVLTLVLPDGTVLKLLALGLAWSNLLVGVFNLLPGLPLDGGRILRSMVWAVTHKPHTGTVVAARAGQALAVFVVLIGIYLASQRTDTTNRLVSLIWAGLLASFIWVGAGQSLLAARLRRRLAGLSVRGLTRRALPVSGDLPLSEAIRQAQQVNAGGLVVIDGNGRPSAVVNEAAVTATPEHRRPWMRVADVARALSPELEVGVHLDGEKLVRVMQRHPATEYLVVEPNGDVFGVLATSDVERALARA